MSDNEFLYGDIKTKIASIKEASNVIKESKEAQRKVRDNLEKAQDSVSTSIENLKEQKKRFQRQMKTQMDQLIELVQFNAGSGSSTMRYIKQKFTQAALKISPRIFDELMKESIKSLGCSSQQSYETTQPIYIKVKSTDLLNLLKRDPTEENAAVAYEKTDPLPNQRPYSMNRELWYRLQRLNTPIDYFGASGQKLFSIKYIRSIPGGGPTGDFYEIRLANRVNSANTVYSFLADYYKSIKLIDTNNMFQHLVDMISGAVSIDAKVGTGELEIKNKFLLILQRILGLCFDSKREIDVSGVAKVGELDGIDESFFEFTDIDLRMIDQIVSNTKNGVVEFQDCENILLPVDSKFMIDYLLKFNQATRIEDEEKLANGIVDALTDNEKWKLLIPNSVDIQLKADFNFLTSLPKAIMFAILSPKVLLPLLIMSKAIGQTIVDLVDTLLDFIKVFKKYVIALMSKIGAIFVEELFNIIKRDLKILVQSIVSEIVKERAMKKFAIYIKLATILLLVVKLVKDWRKCKSVIDEILAILGVISSGLGPNSRVPTPLLVASQLLGGYSTTGAFINVVEELQRLGLPTGPAEDGTPNLALQAILGQMKGQSTEETNRKVQVFIPPLTMTPAGLTIPASGFGISM